MISRKKLDQLVAESLAKPREAQRQAEHLFQTLLYHAFQGQLCISSRE